MRVVCIDASLRGGEVLYGGEVWPKEGEVYTSTKHFKYPDCYDLLEMPSSMYGDRVGYRKFRFLPLSEIDETEFERNYNKELV